jgi:hypothetical protein
MKLKGLLLSLVIVVGGIGGLDAQTTTTLTASQVSVPTPTPYTIVSQDANSRIWQSDGKANRTKLVKM